MHCLPAHRGSLADVIDSTISGLAGGGKSDAFSEGTDRVLAQLDLLST